MRTFLTVWGGQMVSVAGTSMTGFGLSIWVFDRTGSVTDLAFVTLFLVVPAAVLSPVAGALVDRLDRRRVMLASDTIAAAATLSIAPLFWADALALWHIYALVGVGSMANAFQAPAWMASVPLLVPKRHLGRANGLVQLNDGLSIVLAPALAAILLVTGGLGAVLITDVATFAVAGSALLVVRIPRPAPVGLPKKPSLFGEVVAGWRYLSDRRGLLQLLGVYAGVNFMLTFSNVLYLPLILTFASERTAGVMLSAAGVGAVVGSLAIGIWGSPRRLVRGTMASIFGFGIGLAVAGLRPNVALVTLVLVGFFLLIPVANASSNVIFQTKIEPAVQGRVFSLRRAISQGVAPLAYLSPGRSPTTSSNHSSNREGPLPTGPSLT